jgi:hypothetical protein
MLIVFASTVFHELILRAPVCPEEPTPEIGQDQRLAAWLPAYFTRALTTAAWVVAPLAVKLQSVP